MVELLGRLPDPWWSAFDDHALWFEGDGNPKSTKPQEREGLVLKAHKSPIRERPHNVGKRDDIPLEDKGPMIEKPGVRLPKEEIELLEDFFEKMKKYCLEESISIKDFIQHPWMQRVVNL